MAPQTHFHPILVVMTHLGGAAPIGGVSYAGTELDMEFDLPEDLDQGEYAILQCRTLHNQVNNKRFYLNGNRVKDILDPHPQSRQEWILEQVVVPGGLLKPGRNLIRIGYADENYDNFIVDHIVLWYKTGGG